MTGRQPAEWVEEHQARWILAHNGQPGREVHDDPDAVWQTSEGAAWSNGATRLRFSSRNAGNRLDAIVGEFTDLKLPAGFWVSPFSTPADVGLRLKRLGFKCRKHFPGMHSDLTSLGKPAVAKGVRFERVKDHSRFLTEAHPYIGPITTPLRRYSLDSQAYVCEKAPQRVFNFIATEKDQIVGGALLYLDGECAGLWDVGVPEARRNRGIGAAITAYASGVAKDHGYRDSVLIASGMGYSVYRKVGYEEVCKMSYWYSRLNRSY